MTMENNVRFIWDNRPFDDATLSASSVDSNFPVSNLQADDPGRVFKTGAFTGVVTIDVDLTEQRAVDTVVLAHHNLITTATVTIKAYATSDRTGDPDFIHTENVYGSLYGYGDAGYGEHGYGGVPSPADLEFFPRLTKAVYFDAQLYQYWTIEIDNEDTIFSIGRMFLSYRYSPDVNFNRNYTFTLVDPSVVTTMYAGNKYTDIKEQHYRVGITLPYLLNGEAFGQLLRLIKRYGVRRPFVIHFIPDVGEPEQPYTIMYGRFTRVPPLTGSFIPGRISTTITFEEEI